MAFYKNYKMANINQGQIVKDRETGGHVDIDRTLLTTTAIVENRVALANYDARHYGFYNRTAESMGAIGDIYTGLGYTATITSWTANAAYYPVSMEFGTSGKVSHLKEQYGTLRDFDILKEHLRRLDTIWVDGTATAATFVANSVHENSDKLLRRYGKAEVAMRIFCYIFSISGTFRELGVAKLLCKGIVEGALKISTELYAACEFPPFELIGTEFNNKGGDELSEEEKDLVHRLSMTKKGLCTRYVPYDIIKSVDLVLEKTDISMGGEMSHHFNNFLSAAVSQGMLMERVLVALGYMYSGKYEDKKLMVMKGTVNTVEYEVSVESIKKVIYKGPSIGDNCNLSRAYKSFLSLKLYETMLSREIRANGPYKFNKELPYMFYYDSSYDVNEYFNFFQMMVSSQKDLKSVGSLKSLNSLLKILGNIKPELKTLLAKSKDSDIVKYLRLKHLVNSNSDDSKGKTVVDTFTDKKSEKMLNKVIVNAIGKSVAKDISSNNQLSKEVMKKFGFNF